MTVSVESLLQTPNDSIGSPVGFVSPYLIDFFAIGLVGLLIYTDVQSALLQTVGYLVAAALAIWAALSAKAIRRYIFDTPRSKIGSAAQGFVELQGRCEFYGSRETQGFLSGPTCVWHRYFILSLRPIPIQIGASELPFVIRDDTGACIINPKGAKLISSSRRSWWESGKYYSSKFIRPGANMYVFGEMRTDGCALTAYNENAEVAGLIGQWKKDQPWLMGEFDVDQNGELDQQEWGSVVKRAKAISRDIFDQKAVDRVENSLRKPANGMPLLISDRHPDDLAKRFAALGYFNFLVASLCVIAVLVQRFI